VDSPFVKALVYGDRAEMNENDTELFSKTGISHLLAISGFHIGLLASMALIMLKKITK
jgi:Predicted membrane metal-binding protein